jgi:hypothetical protein
MYNNVSMEHNFNIDKIDKLRNNSLNNRITSSKYQNAFIHHNSLFLNNKDIFWFSSSLVMSIASGWLASLGIA